MNSKQFDRFVTELIDCHVCEAKLTPAPVFLGAEHSKIVHISQAPSFSVSQTKKPFTDASGKKLRNEWYQLSEADFYNTENFCFMAVGLCYPGKTKTGGDKQPPAICSKLWLDRSLDLIKNQSYFLIGSKAAKHFFKAADFSQLVFNDQEINGKKAFVLPHPSPLNIKWYKDHPDFYQYRLLEIREQLHQTLKK